MEHNLQSMDSLLSTTTQKPMETMDMDADFRLKCPFSTLISGPSGSGKTTLVVQIIKQRKEVCNTEISKIIYLYKEPQSILTELSENDKDVILTSNIEEANELIEPNCMLIVDDFLLDTIENKDFSRQMTEFFLVGSHHRKINLIFLSQALFSKNLRLISLNASYVVLLKSVRDKSLITHFGRQFCPGNSEYLLQAYNKATEKLGGMLVFDFTFDTPDQLRVRNSIFIDEAFEIYVQKPLCKD